MAKLNAQAIGMDSVRFDLNGCTRRGTEENPRVWSTPSGDGFGLFRFQLPPDLPRDAATVAQLADYYRSMFPPGMQLVELTVPSVQGVRCVWLVIKAPQHPTGMTYVGSLTIPFADCSFVLKMQCEERNPTGMREAFLLDRAMQDGSVDFDDDGKIIGEWNPDARVHDKEFPNHPLSRLRGDFAPRVGTVTLDDACLAAAPFRSLPTG